MLAKKTFKNQLTIPKAVLHGLENVEYFDVKREGFKIVLAPVLISSADKVLEKIRDKIEKLGMTESDIGEAIRWARKKKVS